MTDTICCMLALLIVAITLSPLPQFLMFYFRCDPMN